MCSFNGESSPFQSSISRINKGESFCSNCFQLGRSIMMSHPEAKSDAQLSTTRRARTVFGESPLAQHLSSFIIHLRDYSSQVFNGGRVNLSFSPKCLLRSCAYFPPASQAISSLKLKLALVTILWFATPSIAFKYESERPWELTAPKTLCASGVPSGSKGGKDGGGPADTVLGPCPESLEEVEAYDAIVMDEHGYVDVTIFGLRLTYPKSGGENLRRILSDEEEQNEGLLDGHENELGASINESKDDEEAEEQEVEGKGEEQEVEGKGEELIEDVDQDGNKEDEKGEVGEGDETMDAPQGAKDTDSGNLGNNEISAALDESSVHNVTQNDFVISHPYPKESTNDGAKRSHSLDKPATTSRNPKMKHIQLYLVSLDVEQSDSSPNDSHESSSFGGGSGYLSYLDFLSDGKGLCCYEYAVEGYESDDNHGDCSQMDLRSLVPRTGMNIKVSSPLEASLATAGDKKESTGGTMQTILSARFRPVTRGRHMVVISNCAAELGDSDADGDISVIPLRARFDRIEFKFISKFGELPLSMMGILPFYGVMLGLYAMLGIIWFRRSHGIVGWGRKPPAHYKRDDGSISSPTSSEVVISSVRRVCGAGEPRRRRVGDGLRHDSEVIFGSIDGNVGTSDNGVSIHRPPLLGLQRAIYSLVLLQFVFTAVAFAYYLHLNVTVVDIDVLYGGTMAALASWTPFSTLVALVHFITFLSCQAVVMLATDGTWLIQSTIRPDTRKALYALGTAWAVFFVAYAFLSRKERLAISTLLGGTWVAFLLFNVRRSLRHIRSLMVGSSNDTVMAAGGALVAKRSMYRKMCAIVAVYPVIFLAGVLWNAKRRQDSWAWVGYILGDVYVFAILLHASIAWLPRPLAAMEYAKYSPLEESRPNSFNDAGIWEEEINYDFDDEDNLELS